MNNLQTYYRFKEAIRDELKASFGERINTYSSIGFELSKHPIVGNNKMSLYLDESTMPIGYANLADLYNKSVVYGIWIPDTNKIYIGKSADIGERLVTHSKDARRDMRKIYRDLRAVDKGIFFIVGVCDEDCLSAAESKGISCAKDLSIRLFSENNTTNADFFYKFYKEEYKSEKENAYCYNIND